MFGSYFKEKTITVGAKTPQRQGTGLSYIPKYKPD